MTEILNAYIKSTQLGYEDHGIFSFRLVLDVQDGGAVAVGGICLDTYNNETKKREGSAYGMNVISRILKVVGVDNWEDLKGKYIRIESHGIGELVTKIGNLMKDDWVDFSTYLLEK